MKRSTLLLSAAALMVLAACDSKEKCTPELAQQKANELATKIQGVAASNPEKIATFAVKATELQAKLANAEEDPEAVCAAVDEMSALLD